MTYSLASTLIALLLVPALLAGGLYMIQPAMIFLPYALGRKLYQAARPPMAFQALRPDHAVLQRPNIKKLWRARCSFT